MKEMSELTEIRQDEQLPDVVLSAENMLLNTKSMNQIFKMAQFYAASEIVPQAYRGKQQNCFVACELAARMNVSPTLVMQNLYIVQGKPSWAGQMCKALIDGCGKYDRTEYVFVGEQGGADWGCYLKARVKATGEIVRGTTVTIQMAKNEGWLGKSGSKWATMPEQMMKYRAAAFFARTECPNVLMGFQTAEEVQDVSGYAEPEQKTVRLTLGDGA